MSEEKVLDINPSGELKNSDAPNKFAIGIGNLLTRSNPEKAIGDAIDELVTQRISWENNELKKMPMKHCMDYSNTATH